MWVRQILPHETHALEGDADTSVMNGMMKLEALPPFFIEREKKGRGREPQAVSMPSADPNAGFNLMTLTL